MSRSIRRIGAGLAALGMLAGTGGTAAAAPPPTITPAGAVATGVVFSTPSGTQPQQDAIETRLIQLINGAARGSTVQLAIYFLRDGAVVDSLIKAHHERNVGVKVVLDERNTWEPPRDTKLQPGQVRVRNAGVVKLEQALGTNTAATSFVRVCSPDGACIGTKNSPKNHNKFYL